MDPKEISRGGKIEISPRVKNFKKNISQIYTPGVAEVVLEVMKNPRSVLDYTWKKIPLRL